MIEIVLKDLYVYSTCGCIVVHRYLVRMLDIDESVVMCDVLTSIGFRQCKVFVRGLEHVEVVTFYLFKDHGRLLEFSLQKLSTIPRLHLYFEPIGKYVFS